MKTFTFFKNGLLTAFLVLISLATTLAVEVTVNFTTSTGDPIEGSQVDFRESGGTFSLLGFTDANGQIIAEVGSVNGHATFKIYYDDVTKQKSQNVNVDPVVNFKTILTTFKVVDLDDNELVGTNARYKTFGIWKTFGSGTTTTTQEMLPFTYAFRVNYDGIVKDLTKTINGNNDEVVFRIKLITVRLLDSDGFDIESDDVQYLDNGNWVQFGNGKTPVTIEMLPSSAKFRVFYNGAYEQINQNLGTNHIVTFQTVSIDYQSSGTIEYSFGGGSLMPYTAPMELLPVIYKFKYTETGYPNRDFTKTFGSSEIKSLAYVRFLNSMGMPIAGAEVEFDLGGWQAGELTDGDGISFNLLEGTLGNVNTRVNHAGGSNELEQDLSLNSYIDFSTVSVTLKLLSSENVELASENAEYFTDSWMQFAGGVTTDSLELLRSTYKFKVYYAGAYEEKTRTVSTDTVIEYNTVAVTMELLSSGGGDVESSNAIYSPFTSTTWTTFGDGTTTEIIELLPQNYKFKVYYGGAMKQKNQNVGTDPLVSYQLTLVTVELRDIDDNELTSDNITYFITGNGWNQFSDGETTATMDLLSAFYDFRVYFNGDVMQMAQQIGNDPIVTFVYEVANDLCENAEPISCGSSKDGSTLGSTFDDVGTCGTSNTTSGVWYSFEASGFTTTLSTCNQADYDTKISVFSGSCESLTCVGGQDDANGCAGFTTNLTVNTTPGETYYVLVHGFSNATGNFTLSVECPEPPANALCEDAELIVCGSSIDGTTIGANFDDVGTCGTSNTTSGVWYSFEATESTTVLSTCNQADFDTKISVFSGSCGSISCVGGQDDAAGCSLTTELTVSTTPGETYYVLVHGFSSNVGNFTLSLDCIAPPPENGPIAQSTFETNDHSSAITDESNDDSVNNAKNGGVVDEIASASIHYGGNYPNPFNSSTTIEYEVINETDIMLTVHDLNGKLVKTLVNEYVSPGTYRVTYDGSDQNGNMLPSGMYIYKLSGNNFLETNRMIIQR